MSPAESGGALIAPMLATLVLALALALAFGTAARWLRLPPLLLSSHSRWLMPARNMHIRQTLAAGAALARVQLRVAMIKLVLA